MKFLADVHTHSYPASHDASNTLSEMLDTAQKRGIAFYGVSNHFDYDYDIEKMSEEEIKATRNGEPEAYFHEARHLQEDYEGVMNVLVGAEFGYSERENVQDMYAATYEKYRPDYVINSVHSSGGVDLCRQNFTGDKKETYQMYLRLIRKSLDAPYHYDIVGHIGYIARYVPYEDRAIDVREFQAELDDIFLTIIAKDKILELNSSTKNLPWLGLPDEALLRRYYELGGRKVSFGSDAHFVSRIGEKWEESVAALKRIGFTYLTVPCRGEHIKIEI